MLAKSSNLAERAKKNPTWWTRLIQSETFDKLDSDQNNIQQSPLGDDIMRSSADDEPQLMSPVSTDLAEVLHSSLDNKNGTMTNIAGSKKFKGLGFFERLKR